MNGRLAVLLAGSLLLAGCTASDPFPASSSETPGPLPDFPRTTIYLSAAHETTLVAPNQSSPVLVPLYSSAFQTATGGAPWHYRFQSPENLSTGRAVFHVRATGTTFAPGSAGGDRTCTWRFSMMREDSSFVIPPGAFCLQSAPGILEGDRAVAFEFNLTPPAPVRANESLTFFFYTLTSSTQERPSLAAVMATATFPSRIELDGVREEADKGGHHH